jgi:transcriptional regulator with XRE-family HTH domain
MTVSRYENGSIPISPERAARIQILATMISPKKPPRVLTARQFKALRVKMGLKQVQLARAMGQAFETISRYESGARPVTAERTAQILALADQVAAEKAKGRG